MDIMRTEQVVSELNRLKGEWRVVCRDTGLDYSWLTKLAQGKLNPGARKIEILSDYLRSRQAA